MDARIVRSGEHASQPDLPETLYSRNTPREHPRVTNGELADLGEIASEPKPPLTAARLGKVLINRDVLLLSISYACMNYTHTLGVS